MECSAVRAYRTPAEPALVWHMATRNCMRAFDALYAIALLSLLPESPGLTET